MLNKEDCNLKFDSSNKSAEALFGVAKELCTQLHIPHAKLESLGLDSSFDADLGLDSLTRVEFFSRIESRFDVTLPEQVLANVETLRDLLGEILRAKPGLKSPSFSDISQLVLDNVHTIPQDATNLVEVLNWHVLKHPDRPHIKFYADDQHGETLTYQDLKVGAEKIAGGLQKQGLQSGQAVCIMLPTGQDYFLSFFGVLMAGGIPVPIYPPARLSHIEDHLQRHKKILENCIAVMLITFAEAWNVARLLKAHVEPLHGVYTPDQLGSQASRYIAPKFNPDDIAFIQYTSGSTGVPKGVVLTHSNLLANIRAMGRALEVDSSDVFISWLPLYHDMGLIGAWLGSLYYSMLLISMSPLSFLTRPERWLWAVHRYRGTLTAAPNFAYELVLKRVPDSSIQGLELSSVRLAFNGAEPINPTTLENFSRHFKPFGFNASALAPVYGLAENTVGLSFPPIGRGPLFDNIDRQIFTHSGRAVPCANIREAQRIVSCGCPLGGHEIRVVDSSDRELPDRHQGRLQFRGPSSTSGYFRNPENTRELFHGDWLDSGDLAYIAEGEIYITSRVKDLIIRAGRNIYPQELEAAVSAIAGIRKGCVAVFGSAAPESGTERVIVLAETRESDSRIKQNLISTINQIAVGLIGTPPDEVVLAPPHSVLKTSSGKIRRSACKELYEKGFIGQGPRSVKLQIVRLIIGAGLAKIRETKTAMLAGIYAAYCWLLFGLFAGLTWMAVVICPVSSWCWRIMRSSANWFIVASGTPLVVRGVEDIARIDRPCVLVCNHSSYLDGLVLVRALPIEFSFVAKAELERQYFAGIFLRRIRTLFVQRFDRQQGVKDVERIIEVGKSGRTLLFFPEGTFIRKPGLLPFHMGAFLTAAEAGLAVVPIAIRGTRSILRPDSLFPRHGSITVTIGEPINPKNVSTSQQKDNWKSAIALRNAAREQILRHTHEPDLSDEKYT